MKYENKRNGQLFELMSEVDPKYNTVLLRNVETGKEQNVTTSTLKRWYKKVDEAEEVKEVKEELAVEPNAVEHSITDANEVETVCDTKQGMAPDVVTLHEYVLRTCEELGGTVWTPANAKLKFRGLKVGDHNFVKYNWSNKAVMLFVRAQALGLEEPVTPVNHTFNDKYTFREDTPENRAEILRIMKTCYDWQLRRNLAKAK